MGFETRRSGVYYYRKRREGARVVSEYVGGGMAGRLQYSLDRVCAQTRAAERERWRAQLAALAGEENQARELATQAHELAALALLAAGCYQHKGMWRRRRARPMDTYDEPGAELQEQARAELARRRGAAALPPLPAPDDLSKAAAAIILRRCNRRDATPEDLAALRRLLAHKPKLAAGLGDAMELALARAAEQLQGTPLQAVVAAEYVEQRRRGLGYEEAPALEQPLITHLLTCELRLAHLELRYTAARGEPQSWEAAAGWERLLSAAQRRYLAAVETLARVRRVRVELSRVVTPDGTRAEAVAVERPAP